MASLEIATKSDLALVLPSLLIAGYLEQTGILPPTIKIFQDQNSIPGDSFVQLSLPNGEVLQDEAIVQYFANAANTNVSPKDISSVKEWIHRSKGFLIQDFKSISKALDELNRYLTLRTHIVGYSVSVADLSVWASIRGNRVTYSLIKKLANHVSRWYNYIEASNPWISKIVAELNTHVSKDKAALSAAGASYDIDLPDMNGLVITRFPPEPSGYLHIGHAKAALLNDFFAHRQPGGTLICRFDDTNPSKEKAEFQDSILDDLKSIEIFPDKVTHSCDYFQDMYDLALKLIKAGKAFADDSELGRGDEDRKNRLPSKRRDLGVDDTLKYFAEMKSGSEEGQRWCIRARIAYDSPNGTLRDPVIYRCNQIPHHRTGTQWKMYPTYDFCSPILDSIEGVTLALRTNEYRDRNAQYDWMQESLGLRKVSIWDFSRLSFVRTFLSKRKLTKVVNDGKVWGWDDPRMPTIRGILRRGMTVPALREFIRKQGPSRNVLNLEWGALWALNKKYIDLQAPRYTCILEDQAVSCRVGGLEGPSQIIKPKYVKNPELGSKKVIFGKAILLEQVDAQVVQLGEEITLMNWGNAYISSIDKDHRGITVMSMDLELHLEGDVKLPRKITWLAATSTNLVPVELVDFTYLITKEKLEKDDQLESFLSPVTEFRSYALADCNMTGLQQGAIIQFERKGYYKLDVPYQGDDSRMVFFKIPSGKS